MSTAATRVLKILKALGGRALDGLTVTDIANSLNESAPNICRSLDDLVAEGFVTKLESGRYAHSISLLQIAQAYATEADRTRSRIDEIQQRISRSHQ